MKRFPVGFSLFLAAFVSHVVIIAIGARGLRGSDQYWYATDLVMSRQNGFPASNSIYPLAWSSPSVFHPEFLPPPIHNIPVVYLASWLNDLILNEYITWVVLNVLLALASALVLSWIARRIVSPLTASVVAGLFLLSPQTTWYSLNALSEQFLVFLALVIAAGSILIRRRVGPGLLLMAVGTMVIIASRTNFILLVPVELVLLIVLLRKKTITWGAAAGFVASVGAGVFALLALLTPYPTAGLNGVLTTGTNKVIGNMSAFFIRNSEISLDQQFSKIGHNLGRSLVPAGPQDFFLATATMLLLIVGVIFVRKTRASRLVILWGITFLGIYFATCAVFQPQSRYLGTVTPFAILLAVTAIADFLRARHVRTSFLAVATTIALVLSVAISTIFMWQYRTSSIAETSSVGDARATTAEWGPGGVLSLDLQTTTTIVAGYVVAPSPLVVAIPVNTVGCIDASTVALWKIRHVLAPAGTTEDDVRTSFCDTAPLQLSVRQDTDLTLVGATVTVFTLEPEIP